MKQGRLTPGQDAFQTPVSLKPVMSKDSKQPIGIFDSGLGGLTIVHEVRKRLPSEDIVYFGDLARVPYGIKSKEQIHRFSVQNTLFLLSKKVKAVVVACNSSSSAAYPFLKKHFHVPVLDVIEPAVENAVKATRSKRVGVIATPATIDNRTYETALVRKDSQIKVFSQACPLLVPLVEEGFLSGSLLAQVISMYMKPLLTKKIDVLVLGCTHYPLLKQAIQKFVGPKIRLVDSVEPCVEKLSARLIHEKLVHKQSQAGKLRVYVSDKPRNFVSVGEKFLREKLKNVEIVRHP